MLDQALGNLPLDRAVVRALQFLACLIDMALPLLRGFRRRLSRQYKRPQPLGRDPLARAKLFDDGLAAALIVQRAVRLLVDDQQRRPPRQQFRRLVADDPRQRSGRDVARKQGQLPGPRQPGFLGTVAVAFEHPLYVGIVAGTLPGQIDFVQQVLGPRRNLDIRVILGGHQGVECRGTIRGQHLLGPLPLEIVLVP